ncbi:RNA-directed DNA polymerase, eukaryota, reverse transcriptase zinc-binding domain protein [Tanacetum coccineum]|uniref:RNA-directed DNA polymerase, eukaryota, reverse transcriptase zinc-binding domain protein n=1 Tax=Tanacetum coccineum TaxID=301880 RepID=A0ABQ4XBE0_9ASTR
MKIYSQQAPFLYLGSYVGGNMHRLKSWDDIIGHVRRHLSNWKMKMLSIGGRLTLVKSVLGSMPIFLMSLFKVPSGILRSLESIRSKFFNGIDGSKNKASWVQWSKALASKDNGGLGISSLFALNRGLIFKWIWRFVSQENSLWARVIKAVHKKDGSIGVNVKNVSNSVWLNIIREINVLSEKGINLVNQLRIKLGNGEITHFWDDNWCEGGRLKDRFPRVYALEECKDITVGSKLAQPSITQSFRRMPRGAVEQMQVDNLINLVQNISLIPMQDRWTWMLNSLGDFLVASVRSYIDTTMLPKGDYQTRWVNLVPIKVNTFAWKVMTNSLPMRMPTAVLSGKSSYELVFNCKPKLSHLRTFGYLCYATILTSTNKFSSRSDKCVFIEYSFDKKRSNDPNDDLRVNNKGGGTNPSSVKAVIESPDADLCPTTDPSTSTSNEGLDKFGSKSTYDVNSEILGSITAQGPTNDGGATLKDDMFNSECEDLDLYNLDMLFQSNEGNNEHSSVGGLRRSSRKSIMPNKFNDYVLNNKAKYGLDKSYKYAAFDPRWIEVMNSEIEALNRNKTWITTDLSKNKKAIRSKWIFKLKYKSTGEVERCLLNLAVQKGWVVYQLDINNAFLYREIVEDVYMTLPEGYFDINDKKFAGESFVMLLVYVDDILITGNDMTEIKNCKKLLNSEFMIKDLGVLNFFLA